jgi:hypothetical protein
MVKTKKSKAKIEPVPEQPIEQSIMLGEGEYTLPVIDTPASVETIESEAPVATETAKPKMQTDQDIIRELQTTQNELITLVKSVPKPEFYSWNDAVSYQDNWARWYVGMKQTWNKLNL